jgi:oligopeptide transport system substrate-binding protein
VKVKTKAIKTALAIVALSLGVLCSCDQGAKTDGATPAGTRVLNRGIGPEPETLDPHLARTTQSHIALRDLFEGLVSYSAEGTLIGAAASRWEISDDGLQYTFWLRPEGRWSNGETVVAQDFVYSLRRLVDPATAAFYADTLSSVVNAAEIIAGDKPPQALGVEATSRFELKITLKEPTPYFLSLLAPAATYPVREATVTKFGDRFSRPGNLIGNGAYRLEKWDLGLAITLERNEHYWNNKDTAIDVVRHHITVEPSIELYRYRAGELDITSTVPSEAFAQLRAERPDELRISTFLGTYYYGLNLNHPALGNSRELRQALSMAIDREALTASVTGRGEQPAYSWVPPGVDNYEPPQLSYANTSATKRNETAKRLYAEAGYDAANPLQIQLRYNNSETHQNIALAIQAMWRKTLGFEVELINEEFRVLVANMRAMEITQIFRSTWNGDYNDAYAFLSMFETDNPSNMFGYRNDDFDLQLQRAAKQTNPERRRLYLEEAESVLLADLPVIPIYYHVSKHLVSPAVHGWQDNVLDYHYSQHLSFD